MGDDLQVGMPDGFWPTDELEASRERTSVAGFACYSWQMTRVIRPCYARGDRFVNDPNWCNLVLFYEYFHGDTGRD